VLDIAASLDDPAPTIILDLETGERVAHWAELDRSKEFDENPSLLIHPAAPLRDGKRYVVAVRGLVDASGGPIEPSPAFGSLREGTPSNHPSVEARRDLYQEIFGALEDAGVLKDDLQLAWDFTTASRESNTSWLVHMRDEALEITGEDGPNYTITSVDSDLDPANIMFRIRGTMEMPHLDQPEVGATLLLATTVCPSRTRPANGRRRVRALILNRGARPARSQHGHGLPGDDEQIEGEHFHLLHDLRRLLHPARGYGRRLGVIIEQLVAGKVDGVTHM
jgi:hypothetical protein